MRHFFLSTLIAAAAWASQPANVKGTLTDPEGVHVPNARVQFKNRATGETMQSIASNDGVYAIRLPPGDYDLTVPMSCCRWGTANVRGVAVAPGEVKTVDVPVPWGISAGTISDDQVLIYADLRGRAPASTAPAPRALDGKPSLDGVWITVPDYTSPAAPLQPWASELVAQRQDNLIKDYPAAFCLPQNPIQTARAMFQFVQSPKSIVALSEGVISSRQIYLDGRGHPKDPNPTWEGHAIGRWDGDTLVVDTVGFNDHSWLTTSGIPHTERLHEVERIRRVDEGHLEVEITLEDPGTFTAPWVRTVHAVLAPPEIEILEYVCENNHDVPHLVGK